jgi:hypothetical protein
VKDSAESRNVYNNNVLQHMGSFMSSGSNHNLTESSVESTNYIGQNVNHRKLLQHSGSMVLGRAPIQFSQTSIKKNRHASLETHRDQIFREEPKNPSLIETLVQYDRPLYAETQTVLPKTLRVPRFDQQPLENKILGNGK